MRDWAIELGQRDSSLTKRDCEAIAFVLLKTIEIDNLLWLAQEQEPEFPNLLVNETKCLALSYLQTYCDSTAKRKGLK